MLYYVTISVLVTFIQYSASEKSVPSQPLASREECKPDVVVLQTMCGLGASEMENNWALLDCLDKMPPEKKISEPCENLVWSFKLNVTKSDHIIEEATKVCGDEDLCGHEADSEPGHLLACLVNKRHEVKSLQCGQFLNQVSILPSTYPKSLRDTFRLAALYSVIIGSFPVFSMLVMMM